MQNQDIARREDLHRVDLRQDGDRAARRLERSVAATLRIIAAAHVEREAPPVHAARRRLGEVYGATRLARRLERERRSA